MKTNVARASIEAMAEREKTNSEQRARIVRLLRDKPRKMGWTNREISVELNRKIPRNQIGVDEDGKALYYRAIDHSTVAARRNALVKAGVVVAQEGLRHHKIPDWNKYARAHPVVLV